MFWECFLHGRHRRANPLEDDNQQTIWMGFEQTLIERLPGVDKLYTTWEDIYPRELWKQFLAQRGYTQTTTAVFEKGTVSACDF